jgi:hypothetical protein
MKNQQEIELQAQQTLDSLNQVQAVDGNDYLYSKIINRISSDRQQTIKNNQLMLRLSLVLALFVCINGLSYYLLPLRQATVQTKIVSAKKAFAEAYQLNGNSYSY